MYSLCPEHMIRLFEQRVKNSQLACYACTTLHILINRTHIAHSTQHSPAILSAHTAASSSLTLVTRTYQYACV